MDVPSLKLASTNRSMHWSRRRASARKPVVRTWSCRPDCAIRDWMSAKTGPFPTSRPRICALPVRARARLSTSIGRFLIGSKRPTVPTTKSSGANPSSLRNCVRAAVDSDTSGETPL